jgi:hypothetical protein
MAGMILPSDVIDAAFHAMGMPFAWSGDQDCCASACAAFERITGRDLMLGLRGTYDDRRSAIALIRARGGFLSLWEGQARLAGLGERVEATGCIGVIRVQGARWRVLGLCVEPGLWAAKSAAGVALVRAEVERCWNA